MALGQVTGPDTQQHDVVPPPSAMGSLSPQQTDNQASGFGNFVFNGPLNNDNVTGIGQQVEKIGSVLLIYLFFGALFIVLLYVLVAGESPVTGIQTVYKKIRG